MKVCIFTLGCKVNQYESDALALALSQKGYEVVQELQSADVYIINTCAVTNEAEKKSRQAVARVLKLNPKAKVLVAGCASQNAPESFSSNKNVGYVCGTVNKLLLVDSIENQGVEIAPFSLDYDDGYSPLPSKTRAYVKIQDGCDNFCSYCIIPYLRGRSRSRNIVDILNEVKRLSANANEIVITGINITDFKIDGKPSFLFLLEKLKDYPVRIRLGSMEETLIDNDFIHAAKNMQNLCPHFHLSLQSGSDAVLKRMNRKYTAEEFLNSVNKIKSVFKNPYIATDVIVGFPGETDEEFNETVELIKKVKFAYLHIFPYSMREGTPAAKMKQVPLDIKKKRVKLLEKLNEKLFKDYVKKCLHKKYWLLVEEKQDGFFVGHTENYLKCYLKSKENLLTNTFKHVKIVKTYKDGVLCKASRR